MHPNKPDPVKLEYSRLRREKKKADEARYVEVQRSKTWPIAVGVAVLMFLLGTEYIRTALPVDEVIASIVPEPRNRDHFTIYFNSGSKFKLKLEAELPFDAGMTMKVYKSPVLNDINKVDFQDTVFYPDLSFYQYKWYPIIAGILLLYSGIAARSNRKYWFQVWILGMIFVFISVLSFFVTRL